MNRIFFIIGLSFLCNALSAQNKDSDSEYNPRYTDLHQPGDLRVKFLPLMLVDPLDPGFSFGGGYVYAPRKSLELQAGIVNSLMYLYNDPEISQARGFYVRPVHRWFIGKQDRGFLEAGLGYKNVANLKSNEWVWVNEVNGTPAYERFMPVRYVRDVVMAEFRYGFATTMNPGSRWGFEMWTGAGLRYRNVRADLPERHTIMNGDGGWTGWQFDPTGQQPGNRLMPHINFGIAFSYLANRKAEKQIEN